MFSISDLGAKFIALGVRLPTSKRIRDFNQIARTVDLLKELGINVFLDVGGNRGSYAKHIRGAGYSGFIFSFEPIATDCDLIRKKARNDSRWKVFNIALGAKDEERQFNVMRLGGHTVLSSFLPMKDLPATEKPIVQIRRIDQLLPNLISHIPKPRVFLKMDTQGFDGEVLEGASDILSMVIGLQSEVSVTPIYEGMQSYLKSLAHYHDLGFALVDLFIVNRTKSGTILEYDCLMKRG